MVKNQKDPNAPTGTQAMVLNEAVVSAYWRGWNGKLGSKGTPVLAPITWAYKGVPLGTRRACERKGLVRVVENPGGGGRRWVLTDTGIAAGLADYAARNDGGHPAAAAKAEHAKQAAEKKEVEAKTKRAKHLFRGLRRERATDGKKTIAAAITANGEVRLNLDDLIVLGEGIEKLRNAAPPASRS